MSVQRRLQQSYAFLELLSSRVPAADDLACRRRLDCGLWASGINARLAWCVIALCERSGIHG